MPPMPMEKAPTAMGFTSDIKLAAAPVVPHMILEQKVTGQGIS